MSVRRIKRNYRQGSPAKRLAITRRLTHTLANGKYGNEPWVQAFLAEAEKYDLAHNLAVNGDRLLIAERDGLWAQLVFTMDEVAARLEAESVRNPEVLLSSGFDLTTEPKRSTKSRQQPLSSAAPSATPGPFNQDIHDTGKDSSVEEPTPAI